MVPVLGHGVGTGVPGRLSQRLQLILVLRAQGELVNSIPSGRSPTPERKSGPHTCSELCRTQATPPTVHGRQPYHWAPWAIRGAQQPSNGAAKELSHEKVTQVDFSYSSLSHKGPWQRSCGEAMLLRTSCPSCHHKHLQNYCRCHQFKHL